MTLRHYAERAAATSPATEPLFAVSVRMLKQGLNSHLLVGRDRPRPRERDASFTSCTRFQMVSETMRGAVEVITLLGEATALTLPFFRAWPVPLYRRCRSCSRRD